MEITHNHNAKSQLAKLLASENITVQHKPDARTAWFDVKNRILCLPIWREMSNDLYDLLVVHEVGHALDTPSDDWLKAIQDIAVRVHGSASNRAMGAIKGFLNVIEDARIDKRQKRRFPGARRNYVKGYQELIEKNFFGTATRDVNAMSFIDRVNIYCKGGAMLGIKFTPEEKAMLARVEAAETFDEVLALTEEIYSWSKDKKQETPADDFGQDDSEDGEDDSDDYEWSESDDGEDSEDGEESSNGDPSDDDSDDEGNSDGEGDEESDDSDADGEAESDSDDESNNDGDINDGATKNGKDGNVENDDIPESETEKAWQKSQEDLIVNSNFEYVYVKIPRPVNYDRVVIDFKQVLKEQKVEIAKQSPSWLQSVRAELQKFRTAENATISFMVKEFEMRKSADEYSRTSISKTGVIDTNKLHSYKYNDDLFRRITTVATGKNHGFVMFVDWSGSMEHNMLKTLRQMFSLAMFCKRVQIPFEVYSFRSISSGDINHGRVGQTERFFTQNQNELAFSNVFVRNILSSRMNTAELNEAMFNLYVIGYGAMVPCDRMGSTPLNECVGIADLVVNKFRAKAKVQIVNTIFLTDGQGDSIYEVHKLGMPTKTRKFILQDEITKKSYDIRSDEGGSYYNPTPYSGRQMTTLLLKVLKDRTGCNLIGFYINGDGFDSVYRLYYGYGQSQQYTDFREQFKTDGWFPVLTAGYDEYFILNPRMFEVANVSFNTTGKMTKGKMVKEFIKFTEKKLVSRVLLSRFVKRIAA